MRRFQKIHGMTNTPTYRTWRGLKKRCLNPNEHNYHRYGGRQPNPVTVCDEWRDDFSAFLRDMGVKPEGMTIDRIDNELGYFKENCRWASYTVQSRNRTNNKLITYNNETLPLSEWAERIGISYMTLYMRIFQYKWSIERAFTESIHRKESQQINKAEAA